MYFSWRVKSTNIFSSKFLMDTRIWYVSTFVLNEASEITNSIFVTLFTRDFESYVRIKQSSEQIS